MELDQLRAFIAVLDHGSLSVAAEATRLSRATLRARVAELEEELATTLLVRTHRGTLPTDDGLAFAEGARVLLQQARALAQFRTAADDTPRGELDLLVPLGLPPAFLQRAQQFMLHRYPELRVHLTHYAGPLLALPASVDVALMWGDGVPAGPYRTFVLRRARLGVWAHPAWLRDHPVAAPSDLADQATLEWTGAGLASGAWPRVEGPPLALTPRLRSDDPTVVRRMAVAGEGAALLPRDEALEIGAGDGLVPVLPDALGAPLAFRAVLPEPTAKTPRTRMATRVLRELTEGLLPEVTEQIP